jgi:6-hydroxycyclohex-1-ene-1-carbonyl-CoA dehydrogenase
MTLPGRIRAWRMTRPADPKAGTPGVLEYAAMELPPLGPWDAVVEIAGCGVCHTDLGYFYGGVPTASPPPLVLGHEISGTVVGGMASWLGRKVIVPAVMPCGNCPLCLAGRENRCLEQKMPGNSFGPYGGFASHIVVPAKYLCPADDVNLPLEKLAVVADAVTTPYRAALRAGVGPGDRVLVVGSGGGVGSYMVQVAKALGAEMVVGIDVSAARLARNMRHGADAVMEAPEADAARKTFRALCDGRSVPWKYGWKIFECSGDPNGQKTALSLLGYAGTLVVVGYAPGEIAFPLSRIMALDADVLGSWGCPPRLYPEALDLVRRGKIAIEPFVETRPLSAIREVFEEVHAGRMERRVILTPDF